MKPNNPLSNDLLEFRIGGLECEDNWMVNHSYVLKAEGHRISIYSCPTPEGDQREVLDKFQIPYSTIPIPPFEQIEAPSIIASGNYVLMGKEGYLSFPQNHPRIIGGHVPRPFIAAICYTIGRDLEKKIGKPFLEYGYEDRPFLTHPESYSEREFHWINHFWRPWLDRIAPQWEFRDEEDFWKKEGYFLNNFFMMFLDYTSDESLIAHYRSRSCFQRFQQLYPDLEASLTKAVTAAWRTSPKEKGYHDLKKLPMEELFFAYQLMSSLVFKDDPHVMRDHQDGGGIDNIDHWYLMTSSHTLKGGVSIRQTQHYGVLLGSQYSGSLS
ncbi:hypothetical protein HZB02_04980 [Candidatus Woesearchaeota archaeon]|nr:hypothetical protein [Candidatus Woesearchaeota archaeon]